MTIRQLLREEYCKRAEEIHRIKTENPFHLPEKEVWGSYKREKEEASLILTAIRIVKLFPDKIKELLTPFVPNKKTIDSNHYYGVVSLQRLNFEANRHKIRNFIESEIPKIKPHCHKKKARKMVKRALKYIRQTFNQQKIEDLFRENPDFVYAKPPAELKQLA